MAVAAVLLAGCDGTDPNEPAPPPAEQPDDGEAPVGEAPADGEAPDDDDPDDPPEDAPARATIELTAWVDEAPANLNHRIGGTVTRSSGEDAFGLPVRFEVHRDGALVLAVDRETEADGEVLFSYNAGARPGDTDLVVACLLDENDANAEDDDVEAGHAESNGDGSVCTERRDGAGSGDDEPSVTPTQDLPAGGVTVSWDEEQQADDDPSGSDFFGEAITIAPDERVLAVQLLPQAADLGAFVSFEYTDDADYEVDGEPASMASFACAVERTVDDDGAEQRVTISLTPPEVMNYRLTTSTDVADCS